MTGSPEPTATNAASAETGLWGRAWQAINGWDSVDLVIRLTLVMILLYSGKEWYEQIVMVELSLLGLVIPSLARESKFWFVVFAARAVVVNIYGWPYTDNHHYLITYWCLALGLALASRDPHKVVAVNGRLLLGLSMLFAVLWKATSWEYLDGTMFQLLLYDNARFAELSEMFGEFDRVAGQPGQTASQYMQDLQPVIQLGEAPHIVWLSQFLTWWTIAIESLIAIAFLFARTGSQSAVRHVLLQMFIIAIYPLASVITFAWILIILALADCPRSLKKTRAVYLLLFLALACFSRGAIRKVLFDVLAS